MIQHIINFVALSDELWSAGMPAADQLRDLAEAGVQLVVNLASSDSEGALKDERSLVRSLGMEYVNIPVQWDSPKGDDLDRFMEVMDRHAGERILVHCQANYRATAFIALYRVRRLGWDPTRAFESVHQIWDPDEYPTWKQFVGNQMKSNAGNQSPGAPAALP